MIGGKKLETYLKKILSSKDFLKKKSAEISGVMQQDFLEEFHHEFLRGFIWEFWKDSQEGFIVGFLKKKMKSLEIFRGYPWNDPGSYSW